MWCSALQRDQLTNKRCCQILGLPFLEISLLSTAQHLTNDTEHPPELLDVFICVFTVRLWQPDMDCDRNSQCSLWQAATFHLFRVR